MWFIFFFFIPRIANTPPTTPNPPQQTSLDIRDERPRNLGGGT
jgi:hypothetical protein